MTTFDDRVSAFEAQYAHNDEMQFKAEMRRNRLVAVWASAVRGDTAEEAREFAATVIREDLKTPGDEDVVDAVLAYLGDKSDRDTIRAKVDEYMLQAKDEIMRGI